MSTMVTTRRERILDWLQQNGGVHTASELAVRLYIDHIIPLPDRRIVHPRLNDLLASGDVAIVGKRKCKVTERVSVTYQGVIDE